MLKDEQKEIIAVALSGGKDSTVVLHKMIEECRNNSNKQLFGAIIIDHNMRKESGEEAQKIKKYWSIYGVKVVIIKSKRKLRNQQEARQFRLNQLTILATKHNINTIITGHNLEDTIETYILRQEKGSTFLGLASISPITYINGIKFFRPLLSTSRVYINQYIRDYQLFYVEDSSNQTDKYRRNQIRHHILPHLDIRQILQIINQNRLKRKYYQEQIHTWNSLHLIQLDNFSYKFIWNRLPLDLTLTKLILSDIVHKVKGKSADWHHIEIPELFSNFHINNVTFIRRGYYCYVSESLSDTHLHVFDNFGLVFNYKLLVFARSKKNTFTIRNVNWPIVEIDGIEYDFRYKQELITENCYCKVVMQNYLTQY